MHIPDGFLDFKTWSTLAAASLAGGALSVARTRAQLEEKQVPVMGVMAAFVFAAQMINIPVAGGTSGHFMGAALVMMLLGPYSGFLVMSAVLIVQCFLFQDGGLTALGANIFNMAIVGGWGSWLLLKALEKLKINRLVTAFLAGWFSMVLASVAAALELALSGTAPLAVVLPAMAGIHCIIGILEGAVTAFTLGFIMKVRPDLARASAGEAPQ